MTSLTIGEGGFRRNCLTKALLPRDNEVFVINGRVPALPTVVDRQFSTVAPDFGSTALTVSPRARNRMMDPRFGEEARAPRTRRERAHFPSWRRVGSPALCFLVHASYESGP